MAGRGVMAAAMFVAASTAAAQPNVVLILADDLGYGDIGANGGETIATPHIDALARRGVRLTQGYVSHPVCSPSRAGLLTGRYQQRHGWEFNPAGRDQGAGMSTDEPTVAAAMRNAGYRTGLIGKWHLGSQPQHHPVNRGFDEFFGMVEGGSIYIDADVPGVESWGTPRIGRPNKIIRGLDQEVAVDAYLTDRFTDEAVAFVERNGRSPFFLFLSHKTPHTPLQATAKYLDRYRHIDDDATRIYSAMVASLDDSVGAVVAALEREGLRDDTLIVFLSDNGCAGYLANACSNAPLRGFKRHFHEGGIRVPFIVSWPDALPEGGVFGHPASSLDLMDTFLACGRPCRSERRQRQLGSLSRWVGCRCAARLPVLAIRSQLGGARRAVETHQLQPHRSHPAGSRRVQPPCSARRGMAQRLAEGSDHLALRLDQRPIGNRELRGRSPGGGPASDTSVDEVECGECDPADTSRVPVHARGLPRRNRSACVLSPPIGGLMVGLTNAARS